MTDSGSKRQSDVATRTLLSLAVRIAVIIVALTMITYYYVSDVITEQSLEQLTKYVEERGESGRVIFKLAKDNQAVLKQELLRRLELLGNSDPKQDFDKLITLFPDGVMRNRLEEFDGSRQAFVYIGKQVNVDADIRRRVMTFVDLCNEFGPAWHHRLQDVYFTTPENILVGYWPESSNWAHAASADLYMPDEEYVWIADKKHNPKRETVWTGLFYDLASDTWMASAETPVDYQGKQIATIGHDIMLNELLTRTIDDRLPGSYNLIFRQDGRLITHPDKIDEIKQQQGFYDINKSDDAVLKAIYQTVVASGQKTTMLENPQNDDYLAVTYFKETGWYFVTVYPESVVEAGALSAARLILALGLVSLLISLTIFYFVLKKNITVPLQNLMKAVSDVARGNHHSQLDDSRNDELGRIAGAFNRMTTEIKQRSDELKESEAYKSMLFETSPVGLALCDMNGAMIEVNPAFARIIGRSINEAKKLTYWEITPDSFKNDEQIQLESLNSSGFYGPYEKEYIHADGHLVPVRLKGQLIERNGECFIWSSVEDITEEKKAEDALLNANSDLEEKVQLRTAEYLRAKEEAEKASNAKSDFLSSMSHELRTPMNAILGFAQLLEFHVKDEQSKESINEILHAGNHLLTLINDVLDLSRIESDEFAVSLEFAHLNSVLSECINLIGPATVAQNIQLNDNITSQSDYCIHVDYTRFKQVMLNLLSNAVKYNRKDGSISIDSEIVAPQRLRISVTDTGVGLSEDQQKHIFIAFDRAGAENSTIEGTGIGLVITKRLVELMGGKIGFSSTPGQGSVFWVEINLCESGADIKSNRISTRKESIDKVVKDAQTILYIEDNPANLRLVEKLIEYSTPYNFISAPDASLGLEIAFAQPPNLILMDINLPGLDGYGAMKRLQENAGTQHIPVIAISANAMANDIKRGLNAGFVDYLTKPIELQKLLDAVNTILSE